MKAALRKNGINGTLLNTSTLEPLPDMNQVLCKNALLALENIGTQDIFDVVIADPPYNIGKDFGNNSDYRTLNEYILWCDRWIGECLRLAKPSTPVYIYGFAEVLAHIAVRYPLEKQKWMVWHYTNKTVPTMKFWQRSHESILCLWKGGKPIIHVNAVREEYTEAFLKNAAGKVRKETYCRYSTKGKKTIYQAHPKGALPRDVLKVPALAGGAGFSERWFYCKSCKRLCEPREAEAHREHNTIRHPTQKPQALTTKLILSAAKAGDSVLIPFAGSGAECVAAQKMNVNFYATEINADYVRLANHWLKHER